MIRDNINVCYDDIESFIASTVVDTLGNDYTSVSIVAYGDEMARIILELCSYENFTIASIDFKFLADDYCNEYVLQFGSEKEIWCQPMMLNGNYVDLYEDECSYVLDNCDSRVLGFTSNNTVIVRLCETCDGE